MKKVFENVSEKKFQNKFSSDEGCYRHLESLKWSQGYVCRKCGNTNYCSGKKPYSRRCTRCKHDESVTAHTVFHNCRLPITDAFHILYSLCCNPNLSSYKISKDECIRTMTCWKLKKKIMLWMDEKGSIIEKQ